MDVVLDLIHDIFFVILSFDFGENVSFLTQAIVLGEIPTLDLDNTAATAEAKYSINLTA